MASRPDSSAESRPVRVALLGATGRMGAALVEALAQNSASILSAAATRQQSVHIGSTLEGTSLTVQTADDALADADVAIDFSLPEACEHHVSLCRQHRVAYVSGVTGLSVAQQALLQVLAQDVPVLWSANMSLAVSACMRAAEDLAGGLAAPLDVHILDIHHVHKKDAPSGTALAFGQAIQAVNPAACISYDSRREGAHPGEHIIRFTCADELIELRHQAGSRGRFADGAVQAALWLAHQPAGNYKLSDVMKKTASSASEIYTSS